MRRGPKPSKAKVEPKRPVAPESPRSQGPRGRDLEQRLAEALEQQAATAEILRVISRSPTNLQPVLKTIATNAAQVCGAYDAQVLLREGDFVRIVAHHGPIDAWSGDERQLDTGLASGRAILDRAPVHAHDVLASEAVDLSASRAAAERHGFRTLLAVPLLREGDAIGSLTIRRREVQPFTDKQIALLQTFADQAVIAIENVRLFTETKQALERQTATGEILCVISSSPTDVQPVFDAIARSAMQLCEGLNTYVFVFEGEQYRLAAFQNMSPEALTHTQANFPGSPTRGSTWGRAILDRTVVHIRDVLTDPEYEFPDVARADNFRSTLAAPLLREGVPIGAITVARRSPFSDKQIELVKTFADQAVIAIENVRLFKELKEKNRVITEALEQQTATSEILRVISSSPTDVQPIFDAIVANACRLCNGVFANAVRFDGELIHNMAHHGFGPEALAVLLRAFPQRPTGQSMSARAILAGAVVQSEDMSTDVATTISHQLARLMGFRAQVSVPMLREGSLSARSRWPDSSADHFPSAKWTYFRPSPTRRSSPSRTCGCSRSWRLAIRTSARHWTSKQQRARSFVRSAAHRPMNRRCLTRSYAARCDCATRPSRGSSALTESLCTTPRTTAALLKRLLRSVQGTRVRST
jgi:two-component system, NtrC family, sensor kinase